MIESSSRPLLHLFFVRLVLLVVVAVAVVLTTCTQGVTALAAGATPPLPPLSLATLAQTWTSDDNAALLLVQQAMDYLNASTDPFWAVHTTAQRLQQAGFEELNDASPPNWAVTLQPGGKYYFTKNRSTLVAFCVGPKYQPQTATTVTIIGCHTDSPNLRVKPRSIRKSNSCRLIGVECYGGGLWHTWFDRDLGLSGRVWVRQSNDNNNDNDNNDNNTNDKIQSQLVQVRRPVLRISNLAIHLQTAKEREAFAVNKEDHLSPILATEAQHALMQPAATSTTTTTTTTTWQDHQEPALLQILAQELQCDIKDIVDFELSLFDVQGASVGGAFGEFLYSARLDNLASCFLAVQGLLDYCCNDSDDTESPLSFQNSDAISMICLYDHEEVGSSSAVGAASPVLSAAVPRILASLNGGTPTPPDVLAATLAASLVLSSDQAHAVHPNYAAKHEKAHQPHMNAGMVIKRNSNQRYATTPWTGVVMREIARRAGLPELQEFIVRQDCGCGSTIGPLIATRTGMAAIDMGCPQLSMHSIREVMGVTDLEHGRRLFGAFFRYYPSVRLMVEN